MTGDARKDGRFRALGSAVLPAWTVRSLAGGLLAGAIAMPWLAQCQGAMARPREGGVVEVGASSDAKELRPELVRVPGGTFTMGSPEAEQGTDDDERPQHEAEVGALEVCRTEVTQGQWKAVMGSTPFEEHCEYGCGDEYPAHSVSWNNAMVYMNRLTERENRLVDEGQRTPCYERKGETWEWTNRGCTGYRLPTETEWEYVGRAGTTTAYNFGDDAKKLGANAWFSENSDERTHPVGSKKANEWGLYDVHGNVSEWVWDWSGVYGAEASEKGYAGPETGEGRVLRGGSFRNEPQFLRSAFRLWYRPSTSGVNAGFRCVRVVLPPEPSTPAP